MALDPGALGTLLIGLDHARHEFDPVPERHRPARARRDGGLARARSVLAAGLRAVTGRRVAAAEASRP